MHSIQEIKASTDRAGMRWFWVGLVCSGFAAYAIYEAYGAVGRALIYLFPFVIVPLIVVCRYKERYIKELHTELLKEHPKLDNDFHVLLANSQSCTAQETRRLREHLLHAYYAHSMLQGGLLVYFVIFIAVRTSMEN